MVTTFKRFNHVFRCNSGSREMEPAEEGEWIRYDDVEPCVDACREFVRKCECGEAMSRRSYAQMKTALAILEGQS